MTCGIDGDDDNTSSVYGLPQVPLIPLEIAEKLQGRDIQKLEPSQSFSHIIEMVLSGFKIQKDKPAPQLIGSKEPPSLKGRKIQQLDSSNSLNSRGISIPNIPKENPDSNFYKRDVVDLTFEVPQFEEEEHPESDWTFSPSERFIAPGSGREGLTMEERLAQNGMIFDRGRCRYIECGWLKKIGHSVEKHVRKGAKKTWKFVTEHKKEILISAGALAAGGGIGVGAYYLFGSAPQIDPLPSPPQPLAQAPRLRIHENMNGKQVFDAVTTHIPAPDPHLGLYVYNATPPAPQSAEQPAPATPLPQVQSDAAKQIFDKLFKPAPAPDPHFGIYKPGCDNRRKIEESMLAAPPQVSQPAAPLVEPAPQSAPFQSEFLTNLNKLYSQMLNPGHEPPANSIPPAESSIKVSESAPSHEPPVNSTPYTEPSTKVSESVPFQSEFRTNLNKRYSQMLNPGHEPPANSTPPTEPSAKASPPHGENNTSASNPLAHILDALKRAFTTIGEGVSGQELLNPNTPLDPFNYTLPVLQHPISSALPGSNPDVEPTSPVTSPALAPAANNRSTPHTFNSIIDEVRQALTTMGKGLIGEELLNPNTPLDPFSYTPPVPSMMPNPACPIKHMPIRQADVDKPHIPILLLDAITLPRSAEPGLLPVLCPNGKLNWIAITADWHKFNFSQAELDNGIVHLDEHLGEFMSKTGKEISLVTSQNGINVSPKEFVADCISDNRKILASMSLKGTPVLPLCIGLYNPTEGLIKDLQRVSDEKSPKCDVKNPALEFSRSNLKILHNPTVGLGERLKTILQDKNVEKPNIFDTPSRKDTPIVESTRNFLTTVANAAHKINSNFLWLDLRHSEAGLIFCRAFEGMNKETKDILHANLLSVALGPAEPISKQMAKEADNFYSEKDYITKRFAKPFLNNPDYNIRIIACISPRSEFSMYIADHARAGTTYDTALEKRIRELNKIYGFYKGEKHE